MKLKLINILVALLIFLGLSAFFGGLVLIISPSGRLLGMPLTLLENSPFADFMYPGIILFSVLGLLPIYVSIALIKKPVNKVAQYLNCFQDMYWAWTFCIYVALALIVWIQAEMVMLNAVHWLHTIYIFIAIAIIFVALFPKIRQSYSNAK